MHTMQNTKKGFTLIELLIVITIIGILAAALLPQVLGAPARARDASRVADLNQIVTALETYATDNDGNYPAATSGCLGTVLDSYFQGGDTPSDPQGNGSGTCADDYGYCPVSSPNNYVLSAAMETTGGQGANALDTEITMTLCDGSEAAPGSFTEDATSDTHVIVK